MLSDQIGLSAPNRFGERFPYTSSFLKTDMLRSLFFDAALPCNQNSLVALHVAVTV